MIRKRVQAQASMEDLLNTVCTIGHTRVCMDDRLPAATMSGRLTVARVKKMCHISDEDKSTDCWVELRAEVLTFQTIGGSAHKGDTAPASMQVAFCTKVEPPPASVCTSPELRSIADKLLANDYLAVYTAHGQSYWLSCEGDAKELVRWQQVRVAPVMHLLRPWSAHKPILLTAVWLRLVRRRSRPPQRSVMAPRCGHRGKPPTTASRR